MKNRRRRFGVVAGALAVLMVGGIAFAYWTAGGDGTGAAATGDTTPVVVQQTSTISDLRPGGQPQTLSGNFDNDNDGPVFVSTVTVAIDSVDTAQGVVGNCDASDYTLASESMTVNAQIPAGDGEGSWSGAKISFKNKSAVNQDACKGATVNLAYTAN